MGGELPLRAPKNHPLRIFAQAKKNGEAVCIVGPMVRYSKLPFRETVRSLSPNVIIYSPMILAREFVRTGIARDSDFTTNRGDTPLILQLGASNPLDFTRAVQMVRPYCDGVSLNCGCPIKDQVKEGIGAALISNPEHVASMIRAAKQTCGKEFCIEVKMRIHTDIYESIRFAQIVEAAGADFITVHGRRKNDRANIPVNLDAIAAVKSGLNCPVVANGDCMKPDDIKRIIMATGVDGVMSVRGALANPGIFAGYDKTPFKAIELFWYFAMEYGLPFRLLQHHMNEMSSFELTRRERTSMNSCRSTVELLDWFDQHFDLKRAGDPMFATRIAWPWVEPRKQASGENLDRIYDNAVNE